MGDQGPHVEGGITDVSDLGIEQDGPGIGDQDVGALHVGMDQSPLRLEVPLVGAVGPRNQLRVVPDRRGTLRHRRRELEVVGPKRQGEDVITVQPPHLIVAEARAEVLARRRIVDTPEEARQLFELRAEIDSGEQLLTHAGSVAEILQHQDPMTLIEVMDVGQHAPVVVRPRHLEVARFIDQARRVGAVLRELLERAACLLDDPGTAFRHLNPADPVDVAVAGRLDGRILTRFQDADFGQIPGDVVLVEEPLRDHAWDEGCVTQLPPRYETSANYALASLQRST